MKDYDSVNVALIISAVIIIIAMMFAMASVSEAATTVKKWLKVEEEVSELQLMKTADSWNDEDNAVGVYDSDLIAYYFEIDLEDFDQWDATSTYKIMESATPFLDLLMLGDISLACTLRTHYEDSTGVHGVVGEVVGTTDTMTMTNKTIDGDDNTLQDVSFASMKAETIAPKYSVRPDNTKSLHLHIDNGSDYVIIQASDAEKTTDKKLEIRSYTTYFKDKDGNLSPVIFEEGGSDNSGITKGTFNALVARVDLLERDDEFNTNPEVWLYLYNIWDRRFRAEFGMSFDADEDSLRRFEIYWSDRVLVYSDNASEAEKLTYLRSNAVSRVIYAGESYSQIIGAEGWRWVAVVAFDWADPVTIVCSSINTVEAQGGIVNRDDGGGLYVIECRRIIGSTVHEATDVSGNAAASYVEYKQSDTTPTLKWRCPFLYHTGDQIMQLYFYGQTGADGADHGYVRLDINDTTAVVISETYVFDYVSGGYPNTPMMIDVDVSSGLDNGMLYDTRVYIWSDASHDTEIKQLVLEAVYEVEF